MRWLDANRTDLARDVSTSMNRALSGFVDMVAELRALYGKAPAEDRAAVLCRRCLVPPGRTADEPAGTKGRRADAQRNRARLLEAAGEMFAESGLNVPVSEIARRAGVGIATLARNFDTREAIIQATFAPTMTAYADAMDTALAETDPWSAFCTYVKTVCLMQAANHGFAHVLTMTFPNALELEAERSRAHRGLRVLITRAKRAGALRRDCSPEDLPLILMANAGVISATSDAAPTAWLRLVAYFLRACAVEPTDPLPPAPPARQMYQALQRIQPQ